MISVCCREKKAPPAVAAKRGQFGLLDGATKKSASSSTPAVFLCEGCGDCERKSNCLSIVSDRKTESAASESVDQAQLQSGMLPASCSKGFCPSLVDVEGRAFRKNPAADVGAQPPF